MSDKNFKLEDKIEENDEVDKLDKSNYFEVERNEEKMLIEFLSSKVDHKKAREYMNKSTVGYFQNGKFKKYGMFDSIDKFKKYGHGTFFYFYFLKFWSIVFLTMAVVSVVPIVFNILGSGLKSKSEGNLFIQSTIGNAKLDGSNAYKTGISFIDNLSLNSLELIYEICDTLYSLIFFISIIIFHFKISSLKKDIDCKIVSPFRNTLELKGFKPQKLNKNEIFDFFSNLGYDLKEVNFAYDFKGSMELLIEIAELNKNLLINKKQLNDTNQKRLAKIKKTITKLNKKLEKKNKQLKGKSKRFKELDNLDLTDLKVIRIYITFMDIDTKYNCLKEFKKEYYKFFGCCKDRVKKYYFKNQKFTFRSPDYPDNIKWENLEYTFKNRLLRIFFVILFSIILVVICLVLIFAINVLNNFQISDITDCGVKLLTIIDARTSDKLKNCFCQQQPLLNLVQNTEINTLCKSYLTFLLLNTSISVVTGWVATIITVIFNLTAIKLINLVKSHSLTSDLKNKIIYGIFINFITSFIILVLIYQRFGSFKLSDIINNFFSSFVNVGNFKINNFFDQPTRDWYVDVGFKLWTTLIIAIALPFIDILIYILKRLYNYIKNKNSVCMNDYIEQIIPNQFNLEISFARAINIIIIGSICSSGMPITIFIMFLYFFISFWVNKFIFRYWTFRPPLYNSDVIDMIRRILPYILCIHLLFSIFVYGAYGVFESGNVLNLINIQSVNNTINNIFGNNKYIQTAQKFFLLTALFVIVVIYIILDLIFSIFSFIFHNKLKNIKFFRKLVKKNKIEEKEDVTVLQTYNITKNFKYKKLIYLNKDIKESRIELIKN